jgi:type II secretory pathway pseudopilin PulG
MYFGYAWKSALISRNVCWREKVTVNKHSSFLEPPGADNSQRGASLLEILLVMAVVALLSPFVYNQINETSREIRDIRTAKQIITLRESALNFVRLNQDKWPDIAQIKLDKDEIAEISDAAYSAFIDKYQVRGAIMTDIYLAFNVGDDALRAAQIVRHIGGAAATVTPDGIAYGASWAVAAPDFKPGDLVYRITYNFSGADNSRYLHRGTSGEDDFNVMMRNLNMGKFNMYRIGSAVAQSGKMMESSASFTEAKELATSSAYFASGANMDGNAVKVGSMRVSGDITGFRNITAKKINRDGFSTTGSIISDRAKINNSVVVGKNLNIKSDTARTISGFSGIIAHSLATPFVSADEMYFGNNFGLTVSGELLMSTTSPLRLGNWYFPSTTPPKFAIFELSRANIADTPNSEDFGKIIQHGWKARPAKQ